MSTPAWQRIYVSCGTGLFLAAGVFIASQVIGHSGKPGSRDFQPRRVVPQQRPITDPPIVTADRVGDQVTDQELVLGVAIGREARAYPINMLTGPQREIINDTLGRVPIAATW